MGKGIKVTVGDFRALPFIGYRAKPQYVAQTSAGRVAVRVHDARTLTVENVDGYTAAREQGQDYGAGSTEYLTVRGIDYTACATFNGQGERGPDAYESFGRRGSFSRDNVSGPVREALRTILREAVRAFVDSHGEALAIAEALSTFDGMQSASEAVAKARKALADAETVERLAIEHYGRNVEAVEKRGIDFAPFVKGRS